MKIKCSLHYHTNHLSPSVLGGGSLSILRSSLTPRLSLFSRFLLMLLRWIICNNFLNQQNVDRGLTVSSSHERGIKKIDWTLSKIGLWLLARPCLHSFSTMTIWQERPNFPQSETKTRERSVWVLSPLLTDGRLTSPVRLSVPAKLKWFNSRFHYNQGKC